MIELENLHILINISESALLSLLPHALTDLITHGQRHLRRVYPRGTRIMSGNFNPVATWRAGSHFAALNWQEFDKGMQINEAMFVGSCGWVPKPARLLGAGGDGEGEREKERGGRIGLSIDVIGLSSRAFISHTSFLFFPCADVCPLCFFNCRPVPRRRRRLQSPYPDKPLPRIRRERMEVQIRQM